MAKKAAEAGHSVSEFLDRMVDEYNPRDTEEPTTHTPEQQEILDQLDAEFQQSATVEASGQTKGFTIRKPDKKTSKCHQKAISRANRVGKESDYS